MDFIHEIDIVLRKINPKRPLGENEIQKLILLRSLLARWKHLGEKTFVLSRDLIDAFCNTEVSLSVTIDQLKFPFDAFVIQGQDLIPNSDAKASINTILISNMSQADDFETFKDCKNHLMINAIVIIDERITSMNFAIDKEKTLQRSIDDSLARSKSTMYNQVIDAVRKEMYKILNVVVNTVLYINNPFKGPEATVERSRINKNYATGKNYEQKYIYLTPPKGYTPLYGAGRKIDKRFMVRGHYSPCLSNTTSTRKRNWIMPFWKGDPTMPLSNKTYIVGDSNENNAISP